MCSRKPLGDSKIGSRAYRNTDVRDMCEEFEQHCFTRWDSGGEKQFFYMKILYYTICKLNTPVQLNEFHIIIRYFTISSTFLRGYLYSKWSKT